MRSTFGCLLKHLELGSSEKEDDGEDTDTHARTIHADEIMKGLEKVKRLEQDLPLLSKRTWSHSAKGIGSRFHSRERHPVYTMHLMCAINCPKK